MEKRKVLIVEGMASDKMLIITDAPKEAIEKWCEHYLKSLGKGENPYFDDLKKDYYVKVLHDSAEECDDEDIEVIGYDEVYDLNDYYEQPLKNQQVSLGDGKFRVCGFQFPGGRGLDKESLEWLFGYLSSYHFDIMRIDGNNSAACFIIDSDLYAEWEEKGILDGFKQVFERILNDATLENSDKMYQFCGEPIFLDCM